MGTTLASMEAVYEFQPVGCPGAVIPCPGGKVYRLPQLSLGIELIDDGGKVVSTEELAFTPWPGYVALPSSLSVTNNKIEPFEFYFPRRAFGLPEPVEFNSLPSVLLLLVGLLTLGMMVVAPAARTWMRRRVVPARMGLLCSRWKRVLDRLQDEKIEDDEFLEGIRVAITWYCHDMFRINTLKWSTRDGVEPDTGQLVRMKAMFVETLQARSLDNEQRREMLTALTEIFRQR